jgi:hypothetical protein
MVAVWNLNRWPYSSGSGFTIPTDNSNVSESPRLSQESFFYLANGKFIATARSALGTPSPSEFPKRYS